MFVRWDQQTVEQDASTRLPGYRDVAVRHFDAPEALDTRFYEVQAKSVLNRVPESSQMPFRWTVNPYRGCSHACAYCLSGDTRVLMADGTTRTMRDLSVGDEIVGTVRETRYRRLTRTIVLAKWSSLKPAYRVALSDGTEILASADHRFLTERGWKHVTGAQQGADQRPHLTEGIRLLGPGGHATSPLKGLKPKSVVSVEPLGRTMRMYDITTGTEDFIANGVVSHNCFARPTHEYLGFNAGRDFENEIVVKVNTPERLRAELGRPRWEHEHVALGTNTDPYQWVEGRYELMRGVWEALRDARNPCSVLTKSPLLLRDLDLMQELNRVTDFSAALSIPTLDQKAWRETEPRTPNPKARIEAVAKLTAAGIRTGVLIAPLMPGINDSPAQVREIVRLATEAGATYITGIALHLRKGVREVYMEWLAEHYPKLVPKYEALYKRGAYMSMAERRRLRALIDGPLTPPGERFSRMLKSAETTASPMRSALDATSQMRLF
jgi:DNA repair photolyase